MNNKGSCNACDIEKNCGMAGTCSGCKASEIEAQMILIAACAAHRACCGTEHDPENGKLHGYCVVCGVTWPCETAKKFM